MASTKRFRAVAVMVGVEVGIGDFRGECEDRATTTKWRFTGGFREVRIR